MIIDNTMCKANMENAMSKMPTQEPGIHDLLCRLGELAKENRGLGYQIRDNLFGLIPTDGNTGEKTIGCAKDAIEDAIERLGEANDILRYVINHL